MRTNEPGPASDKYSQGISKERESATANIGKQVFGVNKPNCLTKNLLEMESLPQIRNLLEMREISSAAKVSGGVKDEVNDEREKAHRGGHGRAVSAGAEEREEDKYERVCGVEGVRAEVLGDGVAETT